MRTSGRAAGGDAVASVTPLPRLTMDQLRVGQYVHLDLKWTEHSFAFGRFKIKSEAQIAKIRALGLLSVRFSPELSDDALVPPASTSPPPSPAAAIEAELTPELLAKRELMTQMQ